VNDALREFQVPRAAPSSYSEYVAVANALAAADPAETGLPPLRIAVLRNFTIEPLLPVLAGEAFRAGFHPRFYVGDFDAVQSDVFDPASPLYRFRPDFIILAQWLEALSPGLTTGFVSLGEERREAEAARVREHLRSILSAVVQNTQATVLVNNFPVPADPTLGILDAQSPDYQTSTILRLNDRLRADASELNGVAIVDFMRLFATYGSDAMIDERYWHIARAPLSQRALVPLGAEYAKFVRALRGKARKCLVLDCDNTLWGGVVGEDGLSGIQLGPTYPGSCFVALQREILNLHDRGVILALCSKNNEADVLEVLREHPDSVLREQHFSALQINWDDKVTNLRRIADELNIGLDSMVFVDDNPFEADFVRERLPEVAVLALPPKAYAAYASLLARGAYFDSLSYTAEDRRKNAMYGENRRRRVLERESSSLEEYLAKLDIEVELGKPSELEIPRVSQLTQKTNQFNLTTQRYSEGQIRSLARADDAAVLALKVRDRVAELGLVGVAILRFAERTATIDAFLLSCRAIGRGAEDALLAGVMQEASARGAERVLGAYIPTSKNGVVRDFYGRHGFTVAEETPERVTWVTADIASGALAIPTWIRLKTGDLTHAIS
jgi:FkbH-like protein